MALKNYYAPLSDKDKAQLKEITSGAKQDLARLEQLIQAGDVGKARAIASSLAQDFKIIMDDLAQMHY